MGRGLGVGECRGGYLVQCTYGFSVLFVFFMINFGNDDDYDNNDDFNDDDYMI